jgi:hypothetical protein
MGMEQPASEYNSKPKSRENESNMEDETSERRQIKPAEQRDSFLIEEGQEMIQGSSKRKDSILLIPSHS